MNNIMRSKSIFFITLISLAIFSFGCGGETNTANTISTVNSVGPNSNSNSGPLGTTKKPEAATTNNAPTLGPVVAAYYEALKKKDDAQLKSVLTQNFVKTLEEDMKAEKKSGLATYVAETEMIPETPVEVRNEKIDGNIGVAEIRGGVYKTWTPFAFANEGGKWKLTGGSPDLETVEQSKP